MERLSPRLFFCVHADQGAHCRPWTPASLSLCSVGVRPFRELTRWRRHVSKQVHPERRSATMELPHFIASQADSGCNSRLSSIASNDTSRSCTESPAGQTTRCGLTLEVPIVPRANGRPICSGCGKRRPGYDRLAPRRFEFVPLWQIAVVFIYALRRVDCPRCGVVVEQRSLGRRQVAADQQLSMVPGRLGAAAVLEGGGHAYSTPPGNTSAIRCGTRSAGAWCIAIWPVSRRSASTRSSGDAGTTT